MLVSPIHELLDPSYKVNREDEGQAQEKRIRALEQSRLLL